MAVNNRTRGWLIHVVPAAIAGLVILAPTLDEQWTRAPTVAGLAAPAGTQAVVPPTAPGPPAGIRPGAIDTLPALLDASARKLMAEQHAPGTAVAIVHAGTLVALRAYGTARVETNTPVDAARTLFRVGSVTKPLTAVALLQLVDEGRLDLFRDIREYLPGLSLPYSVNAHQLLTHTAGFDEMFAGNFTRAPEDLEPLAGYLRRSLRAAGPPGRYYSYASPHYAVAGWLLEQVTGQPYDEAMATRLFTPLGMTASTTSQPPPAPLLAGRASGYEWNGTGYDALPYRYTNMGPAGALSTTAADMGRFMLAVLGDLRGPQRTRTARSNWQTGLTPVRDHDGVPVLSPAARARFLRPQFRSHPRLPGVTYGFREWRTHGRVLLHHDGTLNDQVGVILLDPDNGFGMFAASNSNPGIGNDLLEPVLTHLYGPDPDPPAAVTLGSTGHAAQAAGVYLDLHRTRHDLSRVRALMPMLQARVSADGDALLWAGQRWVEVAPFVFASPGTLEPLVFRETAGRVTAMQTWNTSYERLGWMAQTPVHAGFLAVCLLVFLICTAQSARTWHRWREGRAARACALAVALANLAFVVWLGLSLRGLGGTTPLPAIDVAALTLGVAAAAAATLLPGFVVAAWRDGWWARRGRAAFTVFAVSAVAFAVWLNYWKLLGLQY